MPPIVVEPSLSGLAADCHIINIFQTFTLNPFKELCCSIFILASFQQFTQCFNTDYSVRGHRWNVSASAMIMILSYFIFFSSKSSPNPAPIQLMIVFNSSFFNTSTIDALRGFKVFVYSIISNGTDYLLLCDLSDRLTSTPFQFAYQ